MADSLPETDGTTRRGGAERHPGLRSIEFRKRYPYTMRLGRAFAVLAIIAGVFALLSRFRAGRDRLTEE